MARVPRVRKTRVFAERTRHATREDMAGLRVPGQVFAQAATSTLEQAIQHGVIRSFEKGELVFEQGERTDNLPLFCVLSGRFEVIHVWGRDQRHVATERRGGLIAEVELLLRGETLDADESAVRGLSSDQTWAKIRCAAPGELLSLWPAEFLLQDHAVAVAMARHLARKLLLRSAISDPKTILPKPKQVALYLRRVARDLAEDRADAWDTLEIPASLAAVAAEVECAKQTVATTLQELSEKYDGFSHERRLIVVPRRFVEEPLDLFSDEAQEPAGL